MLALDFLRPIGRLLTWIANQFWGVPSQGTELRDSFNADFWSALYSGIISSILTGLIVGFVVWRLQSITEKRERLKDKERHLTGNLLQIFNSEDSHKYDPEALATCIPKGIRDTATYLRSMLPSEQRLLFRNHQSLADETHHFLGAYERFEEEAQKLSVVVESEISMYGNLYRPRYRSYLHERLIGRSHEDSRDWIALVNDDNSAIRLYEKLADQSNTFREARNNLIEQINKFGKTLLNKLISL